MNKKIIILPFFIIAAIGSIASITIHISSLLNKEIFKGSLDTLAKFLIVIWIPVIIATFAHGKEYNINMNINMRNFFGLDGYFHNRPPWMKYIALGLWPYIIFIGIFVLLGFGNETFISSGFVLIFYFTGFCVLYSYMNN